ncbi:hypothetical protein TNCV_2453661 [Trichonephila clavipes]|nr:hypothetical protein TNCV_2453661 [Trichonephila clavipes]
MLMMLELSSSIINRMELSSIRAQLETDLVISQVKVGLLDRCTNLQSEYLGNNESDPVAIRKCSPNHDSR